jgi:hypothetical protein
VKAEPKNNGALGALYTTYYSEPRCYAGTDSNINTSLKYAGKYPNKV